MNEPCVTGHYDIIDTSIENVTMFTATWEETKQSSVLKKVIIISPDHLYKVLQVQGDPKKTEPIKILLIPTKIQ